MAKQLEAKLSNPFLPKESKPSKQSYYYIRVPILDSEQPPYVVIPLCPSKPDRLRKCISCKCYCFNLLILMGILLLLAMGFILWLSQPKLNVVRVHLNHMNISSQDTNIVSLDASMDLEVKIQNQDIMPYSYNLVSIFIGYQGVWLQPTVTNERFVNTPGVSYFEATVGLNGTQALGTSLEPHGNIKEGLVPLDIVIEVGANYHFLYVYVPVQDLLPLPSFPPLLRLPQEDLLGGEGAV
ncbi:hypothetical protein Taro_020064, partial [Colocasia esculenta]|nr:hypothetical protein [Colocasia esculenta]